MANGIHTYRCGPATRSHAPVRAACAAEMHSGFTQLRNHCPMNIESFMPK